MSLPTTPLLGVSLRFSINKRNLEGLPIRMLLLRLGNLENLIFPQPLMHNLLAA